MTTDDSSEDAYTGIIYMKVTDTMGNCHITLAISKTKVASIKTLSIPRLELCRAVVRASQTVATCQEEFGCRCPSQNRQYHHAWLATRQAEKVPDLRWQQSFRNYQHNST